MRNLELLGEQRHPIEAHGEHCLLAAGAGSGKTHVLVERYLRILQDGGWDPQLPGRILAITFTEKAALEMRERIQGRLERIAAEADSETRPALRELIRELETAPIATIHGFCSRLLHENAIGAGLDPRFTVPGDLDLIELRRQVADELLRAGDEDLSLLAENFELASILEMLQRLRDLRRSLGLPAAGLAPEAAAAEARRQQALARDLLAGLLVEDQRRCAEALAGLCDHFEGGEHPMESGQKKLAAATALLASGELAAPWPELGLGLKAALSGLRKGGKDFPDSGELAAKHKALVGRLDKLAELAGAWQGADAVDGLAGEARRLRAAAFRLCGRYHGALAQAMRARSWLDFEDLQLEAVDLLESQPALRGRIAGQYRHVMVDEFQDTNALQLRLVRLLVPPDCDPDRRTLFLVGDARQSIYAFRNADLAVFEAARREAEARGEARSLARNHRSRPALLKFFNALFSPVEFPAMDFDPAADEPPGTRRVLLQLNPRTRGEGAEVARLRSARALVRALVAAREAGLAVGVGEGRRSVDWGDMAVLVRSGASARPLTLALAEADVPFEAAAGREYFVRQELLDLEALVAALDDPYQARTLVRGLRCDLVGLGRADLLALLPPRRERRAASGEGDRDRGELLARLERAEAGELGLSADGRRRLGSFLELRRCFAGRLHRAPLRELIPALVAASDFDLRAAAGPRALKVLRNLRQLAELLGEMESRRRLSLRDFLDGMAGLREHSPKHDEAWVPEEGGSLLRVLTIHAAKGLEFPLVALFDLDRRSGGRQGPGDLALLRGEAAAGPSALLGLKLRDPALAGEPGRAEPLRIWLDRERARREEAEARRLLYVAMTRAEDYLILSGSAEGLDPTTPADWLTGAVPRPGALSFLEVLRARFTAGKARDHCRLALVGDGQGLTGPSLARPAPASSAAHGPAPDWQELLPPPLASAPLEMPVTSLALLGSCPLRWLLERRLGLDRLFRPESESWLPRPRVELEAEGMAGASMGSLLHLILEGWDFTLAFDAAFTAACPAGLLPEQREAARQLLAEFFGGKQPWHQRLSEGEDFRREEAFVLDLDGLVLRGRIDLSFTWRGQRVLIDWKSDRVSGGRHLHRHHEHHRFQVLLYALALQEAGQPVDQALLVFLRAAEEGGFRQVRLDPFDLEWATNRARSLAEQARQLSRLVLGDGTAGLGGDPPERLEALAERFGGALEPPCDDCPFRDGPCPRGYRLRAHHRD